VRLGRNTKRRIVFYGGLAALGTAATLYCTSMPGHTFHGPAPPLDARESRYEEILRRDVVALAETIGERNTMRPKKLRAAADYVASQLAAAGYAVGRHPYVAEDMTCETIDADLAGTGAPREIVVVGAHYDSAMFAPGADDNATGTAAVLALARVLAGHPAKRTIRFALFPNEEPPFFAAEDMGSLAYARELRARGDAVVAMLSLESIGYFSDAPGSQHYPGLVGALYPSRGDFVAFVGDLGARALVREAIATFRATAHVGSEGAALPAAIPGIDWSDHRSFRAVGYPAIMITDTATFRNPSYHHETDRAETLDYVRFARTVGGVEDVVRELAVR
jgi:Zn-dependent M28 family amino/carboxypeptidase